MREGLVLLSVRNKLRARLQGVEPLTRFEDRRGADHTIAEHLGKAASVLAHVLIRALIQATNRAGGHDVDLVIGFVAVIGSVVAGIFRALPRILPFRPTCSAIFTQAHAICIVVNHAFTVANTIA